MAATTTTEYEYTAPFPLYPVKDTQILMRHFDESFYNLQPDTHLYHFVDALVGPNGAGGVKRTIFLDRLMGSLSTIYFADLDMILEGIFGISRLPEEWYKWDPRYQSLTQDEQNEVRVKDSWYRERGRKYLSACQEGGTEYGFRKMVEAILSCDCDVYELWKYKGNPTIEGELGRIIPTVNNEVVVVPHKATVSEKEKQLLLHSLDRIKPVDSIVTIDPRGLVVLSPIKIKSIGSDSDYFEIVREVVGAKQLQNIPKPEYLMSDIYSTSNSNWMSPTKSSVVPSLTFNNTQEYSHFYKLNQGISKVVYKEQHAGGEVQSAKNAFWKSSVESWSPWMEFDKCDSPDNYPGGKEGLHPNLAPAVNEDNSPYRFKFASQAAYIEQLSKTIREIGGEIELNRYRVPLSGSFSESHEFLPEHALPDSNASVELKFPWYIPRIPQAGVGTE